MAGGSAALQEAVRVLAWLLLGAALVGMLARWLRVPYAVALVIGGLVVSQTGLIDPPRLEPDLLLFVLLPPLLFDASFRLDDREMRVLFPQILVLAVPGVLITAGVVGGLLAATAGVPLLVGLLLGSVVAATDPVAVTAVFHQLRVHNRLGTIAEAESLINDGMAITIYSAMVGLAVSGTARPVEVALFFGREVLGGVAIGVVAGVVFSHLTSMIDDHLVEMTLSTALAYGSYLIAQALGTSGALACVAAGLIHGSYGRRIGMSDNTRALLDDLWEYLGFLANGVLFLLVGFSANLASILAKGWPVLAAVAATLVARVVVVELSVWTIPAERSFRSAAGRAVLVWGGLRGGLTIALALAMPVATPQRELIIAMAFGVVLFTLLVQGLSLGWVIRRVGLGGAPD